MKPIIGINYFFGEESKQDRFFTAEAPGCPRVARGFKEWLESHCDVEVHGWDCVDWKSERVKWVLYLDCSWRSILRDPYIKKIPREKRALFLIEPANVNPTLYYLPWFRNLFTKVFTWDEKLLAGNPGYVPVNVLLGAEPKNYRNNRYADIPFGQKKLLFAASCNRWHYMPQSTYRERRRAYAWFDTHQPDQFDFFGPGWNAPNVWYEKVFGYPKFKCWRGVLPGGSAGKADKMAHYKFAICYENNASQPGYISEKITDCFAARCVPIYLGSAGIEKRIPRACYIDRKDFKSYAELERFIVGMSEAEHATYIQATNAFLNSPAADYFSSDFYFRQLAKGLGLPPLVRQ